jgi:hypothetical protein
MKSIAVLFARADSIYKTMPDCDVYDIERDARNYRGKLPVIAHPPCRAWGGLSHFAKPRYGERKLAIWAVLQIRRNGGVLEHPAASRLWKVMRLPEPGQRDQFGGFTMVIDQDWFGHRAEKRTRLYVLGCEPCDVPAFPIRLEEPTHVVSPSNNIRVGHPLYRPQLRKPEREHTPPALAEWLCELASRCAINHRSAAA